MITYSGSLDLAGKRATVDVKAPDADLTKFGLRIRDGRLKVFKAVPILGEIEIDATLNTDEQG